LDVGRLLLLVEAVGDFHNNDPSAFIDWIEDADCGRTGGG